MSENFVTKFLTSDTNGIPNWAWAGIVVVGLGVGAYVKNKFSSSNTAANTLPLPTTGVGPINTDPGSNPPTPTGNPPAPTAPTYPRQAQVRPQGAVPTFDYNNSGVPVHSQPNNTSSYVYEAPWNSSITLNSMVTGGLNGGTTTWYSVAGGYISSFDIVGG